MRTRSAAAAACGDAGAGAGPGGPRGSLGALRLADGVPGVVVADATGRQVLASRDLGDAEVAGVAYRALGFTLAREPELAFPGLGAPEEVPEPPAGARHAATDLLETTVEGGVTVARYATDDPEGRVIELRLGGDEGGTLRAEVAVSPPAGVEAVHATFAAHEAESFHGLGGRREGTDLRGASIATWVLDYRFPDVTPAYYAPQTELLSSEGYALFVETDHLARFRLASDRPDALRVSVAAPSVAFVVAPGSAGTSLRALTDITGRHRLPPEWSHHACLSRTIQIVGFTPESYREKVEADVERLLRGDLPIRSYAYEGAAVLPEEFVRSVNARLQGAGIHPLLYLRSFVADDAAGTEEKGLLAEAVSRGLVARRADGSAYLFPSPFDQTDAAVLDFTNPETRSCWAERVTHLLELGADGFMNDFGEQVLPDMVFADGTTGAVTHNRYPVLQQQATRDAVDAFEAAHPEREIYFFGRAGYSGRQGSAAYEGGAFPGDETVDFDRGTGLPSIVPDMLNRALFGVYGFSTDLGGYADFVAGAEGFIGTDEELFQRWSEAAVFTTHFRVHNSALSGLREPWAFGEAALSRWVATAELHARAIPLMRRLWEEASETGLPPIRPMFLVDAEARASAHRDDQWMVGDDLVVAPVLERGAVEREVWLPEGRWRREGSGPVLEGRRVHRVPAPLGVLPWFTREGTEPLAAGEPRPTARRATP